MNFNNLKSNFIANDNNDKNYDKTTTKSTSLSNNCFFMPFEKPKFGESIKILPMPTNESNKNERLNDKNKTDSQEFNYFNIDFGNLTLYSQNKNNNTNQNDKQLLIKPDEILNEIEIFKEKANQQINNLKKEIEKSKSIIINLEEENFNLKNENKKNLDIKNQLNNSHEIIENLNVRCKNYEKNLAKFIKEFEQMGNETYEMSKTLKFVSNEREEFAIEIERYKVSLEKIESKYSVDFKIMDIKMNEKEKLFEIEKNNYEQKFLMNNYKLMEKIQIINKTYKDKCEKLLNLINEKYKQITEFNKQIDQSKMNINKSNEEIKKLIAINNELKLKVKDVEKISKENEKLKSDLDTIILEKNEAKELNNNLQNQLENKENKYLLLLNQIEKFKNKFINLGEDVTNVNHLIKEQISSIEEIKSIEIKLKNIFNKQEENNLKNIQEIKQLKEKNETYLAQVKNAEKLNSMCEQMQQQFEKMILTKEEEFNKKINEKDIIIGDLQNEIREHKEQIKLIQLENNKTLRSFHDKLMDSLRPTSSVSISAVSPMSAKDSNKILQLNEKNRNTTALDKQQCQETFDVVINATNDNKSVENTGLANVSVQQQQSSTLYETKSKTVTDIKDNIPFEKNETKPNLKIVPISSNKSNDVEINKVDEAKIIDKSIKNIINSDTSSSTTTTTTTIDSTTKIVGILKRKKENNENNCNNNNNNVVSNDYKNLSTKKIRFANNVVDNEKKSNNRKLPIYSAKKSIFDTIKTNNNNNIGGKNPPRKPRKKSLFSTPSTKIDDSDSSSADWIDDIFNFP